MTDQSSITIAVDADLCLGYANCMELAPEVFEVDDDGIARVLVLHPPAEVMDKVRNAVKDCPTRAITVEEG